MSQNDDQITISRRKQMKTPAHTLTRVRNNQRRHRQRRREYIVSLEQTLQETQALLARAEADVVRLQAELDRRKNLNQAPHRSLEQLTCLEPTLNGVDDASLLSLPEQQPRRAEERPDATPSGRLQGLPMTSHPKTSPKTSLVATICTQHPSPVLSTINTSKVTLRSLTPSSALAAANTEPLLDEPGRDFPPPQCCSLAEEQPAPLNSDTMLPLPLAFVSRDLSVPPDPCDPCDTYPPSDEKESTTLCSQAYVLIAQQNFRGLNAATIKIWLDQGFRRAKVQDEGCRVENGLLFGLLDFISGA